MLDDQHRAQEVFDRILEACQLVHPTTAIAIMASVIEFVIRGIDTVPPVHRTDQILREAWGPVIDAARQFAGNLRDILAKDDSR